MLRGLFITNKAYFIFLLVAMGPFSFGCASTAPTQTVVEPPLPVNLKLLTPTDILPKTTIHVTAEGFDPSAVYSLILLGKLTDNGGQKTISFSQELNVISKGKAELLISDDLFAEIGVGNFQGVGYILAENAAGQIQGSNLPVSLRFVKSLEPSISEPPNGSIFFNSNVEIKGDGFLLGDTEGTTWVELSGCCDIDGQPILSLVPLQPAEEGNRQKGFFIFSPKIAGLKQGAMKLTIKPINKHADKEISYGTVSPLFSLELKPSMILGFKQPIVSLQQYLDIRGKGFIGGEDEGYTLIKFEGTFTPKATNQAITIKSQTTSSDSNGFIPEFINGEWLRHVIAEGEGLDLIVSSGNKYGLELKCAVGQLDGRNQGGVLNGKWTVVLHYQEHTLVFPPQTLSLKIGGVKQVVWVRFIEDEQGWSHALSLFGLEAANDLIKKRVFEVLRRIYLGLNIEFRDTEPQDFKLFAQLQIRGNDPNNQDALGMDNTYGKDQYNQRLDDIVGGYNDFSKQSRSPGYGGVFVIGFLKWFSEHPPDGGASVVPNPLFDEIFDAFRPDTGIPLAPEEVTQIPELNSTTDCPTNKNWIMQAACAIRVLGNMVGATAGHEFGHSLGLAHPDDPSIATCHNFGEAPNRLMDAGAGRPFEERAELMGEGPSVFCSENFDYLQYILPIDTDPPSELNKIYRPSCDSYAY